MALQNTLTIELFSGQVHFSSCKRRVAIVQLSESGGIATLLVMLCQFSGFEVCVVVIKEIAFDLVAVFELNLGQ